MLRPLVLWRQHRLAIGMAVGWFLFGSWSSLTLFGYQAKQQYAETTGQQETISPTEEKIALWTELLGVFTAILALSTTGLWSQTTRLALRAEEDSKLTRESIDLARKAYLAEHRTWMKLTVVEPVSVEFNGDKIRVVISLTFQNIGQFAAIHVRLNARPYWGRSQAIGSKQVKSLIDFEEKVANSFSIDSSGAVVMPSDTFSTQFSADAETDPALDGHAAAERSLGISLPLANFPITISVACCVIYKSLSDENWRHTGHVVWLRKVDNTNFDPALGDVGASNLKARVLPDNIIA